MKYRLSLLVILLFAAGAFADTTTYYLGSETLCGADGKKLNQTGVLVIRTLKPEQNKIVERIIYLDKTRRDFTSTLLMAGNTFVLEESTGTMEGEGTFFGEPWEWTYMEATFRSKKHNLRIDDFNYLQGDTFVARKKFLLNGKHFQVTEVTLTKVSESLGKCILELAIPN